MADPHAEDYTNVSPYCYALNNPIIFVDPDGKDIINADEERLKNAYDKKEQAQKNRDNATSEKEQKKTQRKLNRATKQYNRAYAHYQQTDQAILKLALTAPNIFDQLNNMTDAKGNVVDIVVTSGDILTHGQHGAQNVWDYDSKTGLIYGALPGDETRGKANTMLLRLEFGTSDPDVKIVHEGGHMLDMVKDPAWYKAHESELNKIDCRDPANRNMRSVKPAMDLEEQYINIRKGKR